MGRYVYEPAKVESAVAELNNALSALADVTAEFEAAASTIKGARGAEYIDVNFGPLNELEVQAEETIETDIFSKTTGKTVQNNGLAYGYNSNSIAQSVQSGHDGGELDKLREKYEVMKQMEAAGNPYAAAARADYEKDMTAFSMAAAQGLPVSTSKTGADGHSRSDDNTYRDTDDFRTSTGAGTGNALPINIGVSHTNSKQMSDSHSYGTNTSYSDSYNINTTAQDIRSAIEKGFDSGMSSSAIYKNLGYADTYR